jgi:hypothetical protein
MDEAFYIPRQILQKFQEKKKGKEREGGREGKNLSSIQIKKIGSFLEKTGERIQNNIKISHMQYIPLSQG